MEKPMLTREQIEIAKKDVSHPVVQTLLDMQDWVKEYGEDYEKVRGEKESQSIMRKKLYPLTERLNKLDDFSMNPLDIVSIWSKVREDFNIIYTRYNLAAIIPVTYATRGINSKKWKEVVSFIPNEGRGLPDIAMTDKKNKPYFWGRLMNVRESRDELDFYSYGTKKSWGDLVNRMREDEEAKKEFEKIVAHQEKHKDEVLGEIYENFGNGFSPLFHNMPKDMRTKFFSKEE